MQCPNCRKVEKGQWLYASGSTNSSSELSMDDGGMDTYPLYFSFAEMVRQDASFFDLSVSLLLTPVLSIFDQIIGETKPCHKS